MNIDWNKAPEGATHYGPADGERIPAWYKNEDGLWLCMLAYNDTEWSLGARNVSELIARPDTGWNGEGLPPIGTVCEVHGCNHEYSERFNGQSVEIIAHHGGVAVFAAKNNEYHGLIAVKFRPIRTAEQIAAEERSRQINIIAKDLGIRIGTVEMGVLLDIYGSGYQITKAS